MDTGFYITNKKCQEGRSSKYDKNEWDPSIKGKQTKSFFLSKESNNKFLFISYLFLSYQTKSR